MTAYRIRAPQVVHESVDGEVVAIDFGSGSYFSLQGPAGALWAALADDEPRPVADLAPVVEGAAEVGEVASFLDELVGLGLLERVGPPSGDAHETGALTVEHFTDMEDLILLDPVHDVAETGWPNRE